MEGSKGKSSESTAAEKAPNGFIRSIKVLRDVVMEYESHPRIIDQDLTNDSNAALKRMSSYKFSSLRTTTI